MKKELSPHIKMNLLQLQPSKRWQFCKCHAADEGMNGPRWFFHFPCKRFWMNFSGKASWELRGCTWNIFGFVTCLHIKKTILFSRYSDYNTTGNKTLKTRSPVSHTLQDEKKKSFCIEKSTFHGIFKKVTIRKNNVCDFRCRKEAPI